jgi:ABC-type multidrug transport system fused ATPase/permease subunit
VFAAAAFRVMPSAQRTLNSMQSLKYGHSILETISNDLFLSTSSSLKSTQQSANSISQIELKNVSFGYEGIQRETIKSVSLSIGNGQSVGFIGASGAGKSTLIDLVLGLLEPTDGQILVNGSNISNDIRLWQRNIGYVPQTIFLTDDTLRSNIAFGLTKELIDHDAVMTALSAAQLSEFVADLPDGLDTMVGERGIRLSGGQRQRIGIARALYHNPSLLVLDEATSSLDLETESGVMDAVEELHGQKTIIIVAHRLSTVSKCDNLALIENGELLAFGPVEDVMRIYRPEVEAPE